MRTVLCKNQHMLPNLLFMTSTSTWKIMVTMHRGSMKTMKETTEAFITWLEKAFLTVINTKISGAVHQIHHQKSMDANSTVH